MKVIPQYVVALGATLSLLAGCGSDEIKMSEADMKSQIQDRHKQDAVRSLPPGVPDGVADKIKNTPIGNR